MRKLLVKRMHTKAGLWKKKRRRESERIIRKKPWLNLAEKNKNRTVELYGKDGTKLGFIEQGLDGFTEITVKGPHFRFTKVWLYPPADKNGWIRGSGLLLRGNKLARQKEKTLVILDSGLLLER